MVTSLRQVQLQEKIEDFTEKDFKMCVFSPGAESQLILLRITVANDPGKIIHFKLDDNSNNLLVLHPDYDTHMLQILNMFKIQMHNFTSVVQTLY
jgi:hypothetical protein